MRAAHARQRACGFSHADDPMVRQFVLHIKIALDNVPVQSAPNVIAIPSMSAPVFGVFFVGKSFPITNAQGFVSVDQSHWVRNKICAL